MRSWIIATLVAIVVMGIALRDKLDTKQIVGCSTQEKP